MYEYDKVQQLSSPESRDSTMFHIQHISERDGEYP